VDQVIVGKFGIGVILSICEICIFLNKNDIDKLGASYPKLIFAASFILFRLLPFFVIYSVFNFEPQSDVPIFYESAKAAIRGGIVFRDFQTVYSPLFPYLTSLLIPLWDNPKSVVLILILLEGIFVWTTNLLVYTKLNPFKTLVYLALPSSFIFSVLGGQEDILMWGFLTIILLVYSKKSNAMLLGILTGIALLCTKFIFILIIPAIVFYAKDWKKTLQVLLGLGLIGLPTFVILFQTSNWAFLGPISEANIPRTPNLISFFHTITNGLSPLGPKYLNWMGLGLIELFLAYLIVKFREKLRFTHFMLCIFLLLFIWLMLIQQSSYANYEYAYALPLVFLFDWKSKKDFAIFLLFNFLFAIQPAIWWRNGLLQINSLSELAVPIKLCLFVLETILVVGMLYWMRRIYKSFSIV